MTCLDGATLKGLAAGRIIEPVLGAAMAHLTACAACRRMLEETRSAMDSDQTEGDTRSLITVERATRQASSAREGAATSARLAPPERIGPYVLMELLGEGGMGAVYTAYHQELDRKVAIKLLRSEDAESEASAEFQARLLREAQAMAQLDHPNVVAVHDVGRYESRVYLVMDRVEGSTLKDWLAERPRGRREILEAYLQAARGLAAAHAQGLVHRDFKPSNVLVGSDGRVRVTDFGLARAVPSTEPRTQDKTSSSSLMALASSPTDRSPGALSSSITRTGSVMGSPRYMAPEQALGYEVSPLTDQFSFCVALYEALYGQRPFSRPFDPTNQPRVRDARGKKNGRVPRFLRRALMRGLSIQPERRFESMNALIAALSKNPARRMVIALLAAAGIALVVATAVISVRESRLSLAGCGDQGQELAGVWDDPARQALRTAIARAAPANAEDGARATIESLDAYADSWTALRRTACGQAASLKGNESALLELSCLRREKSELHALVDVLAHADTAIAANADRTMNLLQPPRRCAESQVLSVLPKPPSDPQVRAEVEQLRNSLMMARVEATAGKPKEASDALGPIVARSRELHYRPLEAEALGALSLSQRYEGNLALAAATELKAENAAEAAGNDELAVILASSLATRAGEEGNFDDATRWLERAQALLERLGDDVFAEGMYENAATRVSSKMGRPDEEVLRHAERSYELLSQVFGENDLRSLHYLGILAFHQASTQRYEQAYPNFQRALTELERRAGEDALVSYLGEMIETCVRSGHLDEAEHYVAVGNRLSALHPDQDSVWIAAVFYSEGLLRLQQGRPEEAIAGARRSQEMNLKTMGANSTFYAHALSLEGDALDFEHRYADAKPILVRALDAFEKGAGPDVDDPVEALRSLAVAEIGLEHPQDAIPLVERALALEGKHHAFSGQLAALRFTLAQALVASHGDARRAGELAEQARSELVALPWKKPLLEEVETWMRANDVHP